MNIHTSKSWSEEKMEHNLQQGIHISKEDANTECYLTQNNTGRHQFCLWCNFDKFSLGRGLQKRMCLQNVYIILQINQPTRCNNFSSLLLDVYVQLSIFRASSHHHQELNDCSSSLWFYLWSVVIAVLLVVVGPTGPTTTNSTAVTTLQR